MINNTSDTRLSIPLQIYFNNKNTVHIPDIIKSLEGIDAISKQFYAILNEVLDVEIKSSSASIINLEAGSWFEDFFIDLNFENKEELSKLLNKFGKEHPVLKNIINSVFLAVVLYGLYTAVVNKGGETTNIEANNNVIININQPGLTGQEIKSIIDSATIDKKALAKASLKLIAPAKSDKNASINFKVSDEDDAVSYQITPGAVAETPTTYEDVVEEKILHIDNASVSIRATDLDKRSQGWGGIIEGIDKRLPITIAPNVDINKLKDTTKVDVSIVYKKRSNDTNLSPVRIYIEKISTAKANHVNLAKRMLTQEEAENIESVQTSQQLDLKI